MLPKENEQSHKTFFEKVVSWKEVSSNLNT